MSTIVPMPVRVKPPPADTGEIISPGCASFEITTPLNGRADDHVDQVGLLQVDLALGDADLLRRVADPRLQRVHVRLRLVELGLADDPSLRSCCRRPSVSSACWRRAWSSAAALRAEASLRLGQGQRRPRLGVVEVRQDLSFRTGWPSSIRMSRTLPVTLDETVARRRATT
jgi:hypothetical protein